MQGRHTYSEYYNEISPQIMKYWLMSMLNQNPEPHLQRQSWMMLYVSPNVIYSLNKKVFSAVVGITQWTRQDRCSSGSYSSVRDTNKQAIRSGEVLWQRPLEATMEVCIMLHLIQFWESERACWGRNIKGKMQRRDKN